jgi:hypothetical protein
VRRRDLFAAAFAAGLAPAAAAFGEDRDGAIVKHLIAREEAATYAYRGLRFPGVDDAAGQDAEHVKALRTEFQALGRGVAPITVENLDPAARRLSEAPNRDARRAAAVALEADLVGDYRTAVIGLSQPAILQTVATILACHAQRRALLTAGSYSQ